MSGSEGGITLPLVIRKYARLWMLPPRLAGFGRKWIIQRLALAPANAQRLNVQRPISNEEGPVRDYARLPCTSVIFRTAPIQERIQQRVVMPGARMFQKHKARPARPPLRLNTNDGSAFCPRREVVPRKI